eukprot:7530666-Ditylum_brightwellii.AAC.1
MARKPDKIKTVLTEIQHDDGMPSSMMISSTETRYMDALMRENVVMDIHPKYQTIPHDANEVASILGEMSSLYNSLAMHQIFSEREEIIQMLFALGSTTISKESILIDHWEFSDNASVISANSIHMIDDAMVDELYEEAISGNIDLDRFLDSERHANHRGGTDEKYLSTV